MKEYLFAILLITHVCAYPSPEDNIKVVRKYYTDVYRIAYDDAEATVVLFNETYIKYNMSRMDPFRELTKRWITRAAKMIKYLKSIPSDAPMCELYQGYKSAYIALDAIDSMARTPRLDDRNMTLKLYIITKPILEIVTFLNTKSPRYMSSDLMSLLDYSINGPNNDKGKYVSRRKNLATPCCWGEYSVDTWERHYFWFPDAYKPVEYDSVEPLALAHYGAFMINGPDVTWDSHYFGGWEHYQVRKGCDYNPFPPSVQEKNDVVKGRFYNTQLYFTDLIVIQSQRDQTYFHMNNGGSMTTTDKDNSWFVLLNGVNGEIPVVPVFSNRKICQSEVKEEELLEMKRDKGEVPIVKDTPTHPTPVVPETATDGTTPAALMDNLQMDPKIDTNPKKDCRYKVLSG